MFNNEWDYVPATTPACTMFFDTPCCNCGDCFMFEKKINLTENITIDVEIFDNGDDYSLFLRFYNHKKKKYFEDLDLVSDDFDMDKCKFKKLCNQIVDCFEDIEVNDNSMTLDNF